MFGLLTSHVFVSYLASFLDLSFVAFLQDEKLLEEGKLDPRMELALKVRIGEKKVLQQIDQIFKDRELELDLLEYYQERRRRVRPREMASLQPEQTPEAAMTFRSSTRGRILMRSSTGISFHSLIETPSIFIIVI